MTEREYCDGFGSADGDATVLYELPDAPRDRVVCGTVIDGVLGLSGVAGRLCAMYHAKTVIR